MKRFLSHLAALACAFFAVGCASAPQPPLIDKPIVNRDLVNGQPRPLIEAVSSPTIPPSGIKRPEAQSSLPDPGMDSLSALTLLGLPPVAAAPAPVIDAKELECMTKALYFEARGEDLIGQYAVGYVIMNRAKDARFPNTICGVVHQGVHRNGKPVPGRCEFSFHCDGRREVVSKPSLYERMRELATHVMQRSVDNPIDQALFFHAKSVSLTHQRPVVGRKKIGNHIFYAYRDPKQAKPRVVASLAP